MSTPLFRMRAGVIALALVWLTGGWQNRAQPIVILVSFDAWRWDYTDRAAVPHVRDLAARGVRSDGLVPSFPSVTFPNHYTLVTGLYPEHHGIVSNNMIDASIGSRFSMSAPTAKDPRWWGGEPIWVTAIRQGQRASSMFWPGSEVEIGGIRPTAWRPFDDAVSNADRVKQVLDWLALPEAARPTFITVYFSEVDHAGHDFGPDAPQVLAAAAHVDDALGLLEAGVRARGLSDRTTFVLVSDHGMSQLSRNRVIYLDDYIDVATLNVIDWSPALGLSPRSGSVDDVYHALRGKHPALSVYRRHEVPADLHYRAHARIPPIVGLADDGWTIMTHERAARASTRAPGGTHGYDPRFRSMHGLFIAAGPSIKQGARVPQFQNVHVYEFLCALLGLTPAKNDGDPAVTRGFFKN